MAKKIVLATGTYKILKQIGEGGFSFVFLVKDVATGQQYALKRMICSNPRNIYVAEKEIDLLKRLKDCNYVVKMVSYSSEREGSNEIRNILMEFSENGSVVDVMNNRLSAGMKHFSEQKVIEIFASVVLGIAAMHTLDPPAAHRDIKAENILVHGGKMFLTDFGSACFERYGDVSHDAPLRAAIEDEVSRETTMVYLAPELADLYRGWPITEKTDIWSLGVLLYKLCFFKTPFDDNPSPLAIVGGRYTFPKVHPFSDTIIELIKYCLVVDPAKRPDIHQLINQVYAIAQALLPASHPVVRHCAAHCAAHPVNEQLVDFASTPASAQSNQTAPSTQSDLFEEFFNSPAPAKAPAPKHVPQSSDLFDEFFNSPAPTASKPVNSPQPESKPEPHQPTHKSSLSAQPAGVGSTLWDMLDKDATAVNIPSTPTTDTHSSIPVVSESAFFNETRSPSSRSEPVSPTMSMKPRHHPMSNSNTPSMHAATIHGASASPYIARSGGGSQPITGLKMPRILPTITRGSITLRETVAMSSLSRTPVQTEVLKATSTKGDPVKTKHIRALAVHTWDHKSFHEVFNALMKRPVLNPTVATKVLTVVLRLIQTGHPSTLTHCITRMDTFRSLLSSWVNLRGEMPNDSALVSRHLTYLSTKLRTQSQLTFLSPTLGIQPVQEALDTLGLPETAAVVAELFNTLAAHLSLAMKVSRQGNCRTEQPVVASSIFPAVIELRPTLHLLYRIYISADSNVQTVLSGNIEQSYKNVVSVVKELDRRTDLAYVRELTTVQPLPEALDWEAISKLGVDV
ncbi:Protein kinase domain [Carpediemonas membranifera]|uniref:non-specific serine/threonine protein kinase n=1 Tax=Carpediemonas membranifera TaxID=201153 RepID=A0A8J6BHD2_9EUKA|nr:Protein kinase domain [Carpediemonas membranifera]|eukprot:KAG9397497.1 Protein kinase domain [Carpediemonas membranifera]